jgi:hypothetical protein
MKAIKSDTDFVTLLKKDTILCVELKLNMGLFNYNKTIFVLITY